MDERIKNAIESYQCPGCACGSGIECFKPDVKNKGIGCGKHVAGTVIRPIVGRVFLGLPNGFNRIGDSKMSITMFETFESSNWIYDMCNIPVWKHVNNEEHTLVRGISPRTNRPFLHIFLENCIEKIDCREITEYDINKMD